MAKKKPATSASIPVDAHKHVADRRTNIPTRELAEFATDDGIGKAVYARDRSLDPQLVWKGKDKQDAKDALEVPAVPIYVQETIEPQVVVEDVRAWASAGKHDAQATLFDDFYGVDDFQKKTDFYKHDLKWKNRLILGDSLLVMASLAEKERLRGKVQCVYFDPPYGIKFGSNWQVSTRKRDVKDAKSEDLTRQPEQIKAFRDTWELGIHSYLSYMRDRLAARDLLTDSGSIFVQIGDGNVHLVRSLVDEVFGSGNFCALIPFKTTSSANNQSGLTAIGAVCDYVLWYAKGIEYLKYRQLYKEKAIGAEGGGQYTWVEDPSGHRRRAESSELSAPGDPRIFRPDQLVSQGLRDTTTFDFEFDGKRFSPKGGHWKTTRPGMERLAAADRLLPIGNTLTYIRYLNDFPVFPLSNLWDDTVTSGFADSKMYVVQTNTRVIERCILMTTAPGDLVLDPTCGSGTTSYVAEQWGRRWITIDTSRVALSLARTRLMAARFPYYLLADSVEGRAKQTTLTGKPTDPAAPAPKRDLHSGFVYKSVPHVTLKSIANNPDIDEIHKQAAPTFLQLLKELNAALGAKWNEWDVPPLPPAPGWTAAAEVLEQWAAKAKQTLKDWSEKARRLLERWWDEKKRYRTQIDAAIARHADSETLYDQPYEDKNIVRLSGPFTVESLSPHKALATPDEPAPARRTDAVRTTASYHQTIRENLFKAGVKGTDKAQRIALARLDPHPGRYIHAEGETTDGTAVRVSIGPDSGTVGDAWIADAAVEAKKGSHCDLLLVCAFAFEASVHEKTAELAKEIKFGNLRVLAVRMNPDLAMFGDDTGRELLKKTGAANLFTVFGEPDLSVTRDAAGKVVVTVRGLDVFDPTTSEVRSGGTDDIACWFIDIDYDEKSFVVRHAYFLGADEPYEKLKKALKAEIDETEWAKLYSATSQPFDPPARGKIAVKVINHFGDEVLKVYPVPTKTSSPTK